MSSLDSAAAWRRAKGLLEGEGLLVLRELLPKEFLGHGGLGGDLFWGHVFL